MTDEAVLSLLEKRLGRRHARQRLGVEKDHEAQVFGQGINFFHIENLTIGHAVIRAVLMGTGLYWRGLRNAAKVEVRENLIDAPHLPEAFDGLSILQISDLHVDMSEGAMARLIQLLPTIPYDLCILTGDYRGNTWGPYEPSLAGMEKLCAQLKGPVYGVLGNHDTILMVPRLEEMGVRMLLNEADTIERGDERLHLAGVDDAHFYRMENIEKAADNIPHEEFSILVTHTPEIYRQAAHADFDVLISGHTHGGQICLPGGIPITLSAVLPRALGSGPWRHHDMIGYTAVGAGSSVVPVRFNCPPEVTLHRLRRRRETTVSKAPRGGSA
ncbi:MAG: metallophosphoesterase [Methyloceanibacter sp.]|jgi:predicted MPP superfamily phosphohydrolase|uniref:metallophosphoesterase n=1 Tax=Methyloceanibacter sp. TaxID=1965321 RepID=UPI00356AF803